jgi:hypothetical protein
MKKFLLIIFIPLLAFSQKTQLKAFKGVLVCDSLKVERATITNLTSSEVSISDDLGFFSIFAKEGDTIIVTNVNFETEQMVLKSYHFEQLICKIQLSLKINQLDEVKIGPYKLTGDLVYDAKRIKVKPAMKLDMSQMDLKNIEVTGVKTTQNLAMPNFEQPFYGVNFIKLGKKLINLIDNSDLPKPKPENFLTFNDFTAAMHRRFSDDFFENKLMVKSDKIGLFLDFCFSQEIQKRKLLEAEKGLELIDFLMEKSLAFQNNKK